MVEPPRGRSDVFEVRLSSRCDRSESLKVRFISCCDTPVRVLWVTPEGHHYLYKTLEPREYLDVNTFIKHTWVFKEEKTGMTIMANNKPYFYGLDEFPHIKPDFRTNIRFGVALSRPRVDKLERLCISLISRCIRKCSDVKYLELPNILKKRLIKQMHTLVPDSHCTAEDKKICENNLQDFSRIIQS